MKRGKITFKPRVETDGEEIARWLLEFIRNNKLTIEITADERESDSTDFANEQLEQAAKEAVRDGLDDPEHRREALALASYEYTSDKEKKFSNRYRTLKKRRDKRRSKQKKLAELIGLLLLDGWKICLKIVEQYLKTKLP